MYAYIQSAFEVKERAAMIRFGRKIISKAVEYAAQNYMGTITHVKTEEPLVALTFDDGPHPDHTPDLLDILGRCGAHATFFMVGEAAAKYPDLVGRVAMAGHAIGNHSWDHPSFPLIRGSKRRAQIRACSDAIAPYGQKLFRPPYGNQNAMSRFDAFLLGYQVVTWNVVAQDWLNDDAETIVNRIDGLIQNGSVVLFHDSLYHSIEDQYADREATIKAVGILLERLGPHFRFVTIPELIQHGCPQRSMWFQQPNAPFLNKLKGKYNWP